MGVEGNSPTGQAEERGALFSPGSTGGGDAGPGWGGFSPGATREQGTAATGRASGTPPVGWLCQQGQVGARQRNSPKGPGGSGVGARRE